MSPIVGIILLFGLVFIGAAAVATAGIVLMDDIQSTSVAERTEQCTMETNHRIATVIANGGVEELPCDGGQYVDDGTVHLVWHNGSAGQDMLTTFSHSTATIDELGALEYNIEGESYAYQAGGIWKGTGDSINPITGPSFSYQSAANSNTNSAALEINPIVVDGQQSGTTPKQLSRGMNSSDAFADALRAGERNGYTHLTLLVESKYHAGWKSHFDSKMNGSNVAIKSGGALNIDGVNEDQTVAVEISNAIDPEPRFEVVADNGLVGATAAQTDVYAPQAGGGGAGAGGNKLRISAAIENTGVQTGSTTATLKIPGTGITDDVDITNIKPGETETVEFAVNYGNVVSSNMEPGNVYEYNITTEDDYLNKHGSFLYATQEDADLAVENPRVDGKDASSESSPVLANEQNVTLSVDVHNIGGSSVTDAELALSMVVDEAGESDPYNLAGKSYEVDRKYGENATVTWELNRSSLLEAEHEFTVSAVNNASSTTGYFVVENGVDIGDTELRLDPGTQVNATVAGTEMSSASRSYSGEHTVGHPITDRSAGSFTTDENGMSYSFDAPGPDSESDELQMSDDGGWVAPDGTKPDVSVEWNWGWDYSWTWDTDELVWDEDAGYELTWEQGGNWGWTGPTGDDVVIAGKEGETVGEPTGTLPRYDIQWLPGSATLITQPVDENNDPIEEPSPIDGVDWHGTNLNVEKDATRPIYEHSFQTNERVSFQMEASSHMHGGGGFCGPYATETSYEFVDGSVYANEYCAGSGSVNGGDLVNLNADTNTESTNVRVLQDGDQLPDIESGSEWQRDVDELLERDGIDATVRPDGTLDLKENEFIFAFELTHHPEQYNTAPNVPQDISQEDYWNLAHSNDGDPNFNDMIVHVEINPPDVPADFELDGDFHSGSGTTSIGPGSSNGTGGSSSDTDSVDVGSDEIIIG
ncbi:DUF7289 family protein [Halovivax ruber]|uniref:DUF7289 family protein n=1 Tax=Halovivax ruber TaxID=387341 RepID=UPI0011E560DF|nr:hypothetical protein [Halovivax ruber]